MENEAPFEIDEDPVWPELVRMLSGPGPDNRPMMIVESAWLDADGQLHIVGQVDCYLGEFRTAEVVVDRRFAIGAGFYKDVASSVLTASQAVTELVCSADPPQKVVLVGQMFRWQHPFT